MRHIPGVDTGILRNVRGGVRKWPTPWKKLFKLPSSFPGAAGTERKQRYT